ncbi:MAG: TatD family hydrolase, partial [Actinomycetia bacterium]|nr:TatD family hydrolase [Actinomycetes bacterium]
MKPTRTTLAAAAVLTVPLVLSACGGDDSGGDGGVELTLAHSYTEDQPQHTCGAEVIKEEAEAAAQAAVELANSHKDIFAAVGIQPNYVAEEKPGDWEKIVALADEPRVIAIGETGLDRHWDYTPFDQQIEAFDRHLELSRRTGKPFIVHCRESEADVVSQLQNAATN